MKLLMEDLFTNMMVKHNELIHPDYDVRIVENPCENWILTATLVSGVEFRAESQKLDDVIKRFNDKWTLRYVKRW